MNIRPDLEKFASQIVRDHLKTGNSLTNLVASTASANCMSDRVRGALAVLTNQQMIKETNKLDFDQVETGDVDQLLYPAASNRMKVAYQFPEFTTNLPDPMEKFANEEEPKYSPFSPVDVSKMLRERANFEERESQIKLASVAEECAELFNQLEGQADFLKKIGIKEADIRENLRGQGIEDKEALAVPSFFFKKTKSASIGFSNAAYHDGPERIEAFVNNTIDYLMAHKRYKEAKMDFETKRAIKEATYKQGRIML